MYLDDIAVYILGVIGIIAFLALSGFVEGGNYMAAIVSLAIMAVSFRIALSLEGKIEHKKR